MRINRMRRDRSAAGATVGRVVAVVLVVGSFGLVAVPAATADPPAAPGREFGLSHRPVCPPVPAAAHCHAQVVVDAHGGPQATTSYSNGLRPADLKDAYKLPAGGAGQTVAIVDAYDNPTAEADLTVYRAQFGLPACTTANGCFRKVDQRGGTNYPKGDVGWGQEIALDLDMVSAACPACNILLVEADSNSFTNLAAAVDRAATMGANAISNSYGGSEFASEATWESHYNHPGVAITVSSGDAGYGVEFPAASRYVTAVGGTTLKRSATTRGWTETVWSGAGSGCSSYITKPSWQTDTGCARRTVADVAAVADPNTGVAVYDSFGSSSGANWLVFGGTSVAAPIIAGVYGLAGNAGTLVYGSNPYTHLTSLFDVTSGSNGRCTTGKRTANAPYLCTGLPGYDGPTGNGTPNGIGAF
jgi:subtilase family serine protease